MAERRMFAKSIVLSDAFLDMPMSARCLYFTLAMFADDDGFVNNPKSIMRQCGASVGDMEILSTKKFVIFFDNGVLVIKHWRIHNYIQNDRYQKTKYLDEMDSLYIGADKIYHVKCKPEEPVDLPTLPSYEEENKEENYEDFSMYPECIQPVSEMDTQYSIDKDSIDKDSIEENNGMCGSKELAPPETEFSFCTKDGTYYLDNELYNDFSETYKDISVDDELRKAKVWCRANESKRKTNKGMPKFLNLWLNKAQSKEYERIKSQPEEKATKRFRFDD